MSSSFINFRDDLELEESKIMNLNMFSKSNIEKNKKINRKIIDYETKDNL